MQRSRRAVFGALAALVLTFLSFAGHAGPGDEVAARGLDVFVHAPDAAPSGGALDVMIEAFAFPTATTMVPVGGAEVEAAWDPEQLGEATAAPPSVRATADASGRARLVLPVPVGPDRALSMLLAVRARGHERVRQVTVKRGPVERVAVHVVDPRVLPGSSVTAWVVVTSAVTGTPVARAPLEVALVEGGYERDVVRATTDEAGTAAVRVRIPRVDEPVWSWTLRARTLRGPAAATGSVALSPREETPGKPRLEAHWVRADLRAGERGVWRASVRDATDQPIAGADLRVWVGPRGTHPPKDDASWDKLPLARSDARGEVEGAFDAPANVVRGVGSALELIARTRIEGHDLSAKASANVGVPASTAELLPEAGQLVPGVPQHLMLRVRDGHGAPVRATFRLEGDGLAADATTDEHGETDITWQTPIDLGASRRVGPCAGGVAATVRVRPVADVPALGRRDPFELCVPVDREAQGIVAVDRLVAHVGETVHVAVLTSGAHARARSTDAWSVLLLSDTGDRAATAWMPDGERGVDLPIPEGRPGVWSVSVASPSPSRRAQVAGRSIFVAPRAVPRLVASVSGRAAPGGLVDVDADLTDGKGRALTGTVSAVLVDLHGGGGTGDIERFDTRIGLCAAGSVEPERCEAFLGDDAAAAPLRRAASGLRQSAPRRPEIDPGADARERMEKVFGEVMKSLEGAVFEASSSADQLRDVRRKDRGGWAFNPELLTLVTAAMDPKPTTPGGELLALGDLMAVDPQVTFDHVARRVTRLKIFRVLSAVRQFKKESGLEPDEPIFKDPNAILRRLVREDKLDASMLVDPWGGTLAFTRAAGPPTPFLSVVRGFELHAPGPDGALDTADDVKDPFERVLKSGTPYAKALHEDRIVDAKLDAEVADATVSAWETMFDELTGTSLGNNGEGGVGRGEGIGLGGIGTIGHGAGGGGRGSDAFGFGGAFWSEPTRTDAKGHVRIRVPLGDAETTWRVALVAVPDVSTPATTTVDVPTFLPLSARVDTGATRWVEGDHGEATVILRNRTDQRARLEISVAAGGAAKLGDRASARRTVDVPARGASEVPVVVVAERAGRATLAVDVSSGGKAFDRLTHGFDVAPAGEPTELTESRWIEKQGELVAPVERGVRLTGAPRLVLERGFEGALGEALEALEPERLDGPDAMVDAIEVAARVRSFAVHHEGEGSRLAARAAGLEGRARGRLQAYLDAEAELSLPARLRHALWSIDEKSKPKRGADCPPDELAGVAMLDAEPALAGGAALACWDAFVSRTLADLDASSDPVAIAEALLAEVERPHRDVPAAHLASRLRELVALRPSGAAALPPFVQRSRAARATVFAALLRASAIGTGSVASAERLTAWVRVQEDAEGGYGSASATRAVVRALVAAAPSSAGTSRITVTSNGVTRSLEMAGPGRVEVALPAAASRATITVDGAPVVARLERPVLRLWTHAPNEPESVLRVDATWPEAPRAGKNAVLHLALRHGFARALTVDVRVPLPPGVTLAEPTDGVRVALGQLIVRRKVFASMVATPVEIPIRFAFAGVFTVPEATARVAFEQQPRTVVPARPLSVR